MAPSPYAGPSGSIQYYPDSTPGFCERRSLHVHADPSDTIWPEDGCGSSLFTATMESMATCLSLTRKLFLFFLFRLFRFPVSLCFLVLTLPFDVINLCFLIMKSGWVSLISPGLAFPMGKWAFGLFSPSVLDIEGSCWPAGGLLTSRRKLLIDRCWVTLFKFKCAFSIPNLLVSFHQKVLWACYFVRCSFRFRWMSIADNGIYDDLQLPNARLQLSQFHRK